MSATEMKLEPMDEHNQLLQDNTHPRGWSNPRPADRYHVVVIGSGAGGLVTAIGAASLGAKVALVEKHHLGGDCLNVGCVPSKALITAARTAHTVRSAERFGVKVEEFEVDFGAVMERLRRRRAEISHNDAVKRIKSFGVDVFFGEAKFRDSETVEVDGTNLKFSKAVIATGGRPFVPPVPGLQENGYLTNINVFNLTERPDHLLVLGGGPIGCELAQSFRRLGSQVTILEMADQFLIREDRDAAEILARQFQKDGVEVFLSSQLVKIEAAGNRKRAFVKKGDETREILFDQILVGAGRVPNVESLGLESVGVEYDRRGVKVDETLRTTNPRMFAVGDVCLPYKFTHMADATARIVVQNLFFPVKRRWTDLVIPWCTYTNPEIAHVGLYEKDAEQNGIEVDTFVKPLSENDRSILEEDSEGFVKVHLRKGTDEILGATIVAAHAGEMISEITLAMTARTGFFKKKVGFGQFSGTIHPYPTQAEAIRQAADLYARTRLTPLTKRLLSLFIR